MNLKPLLSTSIDIIIFYNQIAFFVVFIGILKVTKVKMQHIFFTYTLRTLIFARHLFSRVHIFAAYIFAPEALGINFRDVSIFAWWLLSFFFSRKSIGSNFRACLHAYK